MTYLSAGPTFLHRRRMQTEQRLRVQPLMCLHAQQRNVQHTLHTEKSNTVYTRCITLHKEKAATLNHLPLCLIDHLLWTQDADWAEQTEQPPISEDNWCTVQSFHLVQTRDVTWYPVYKRERTQISTSLRRSTARSIWCTINSKEEDDKEELVSYGMCVS